MLAREAADDALALAATSDGLQVTLIGPQGHGVDGRRVTIDGRTTTSCGAGCYALRTRTRGKVTVGVGYRHFMFVVPRTAPDATALMHRATETFRASRSVTYVERLASSPTDRITSTFALEAPNRVEYHIEHGSTGIVIGTKRWDRANGRWTESPSTLLQQPSPVWGSDVTNAHVLSRSPQTVVVSFLNPNVPAWFDARLDARTLLPRRLDMIAAAHFMHHRYISFNAPRKIFPPR